MRTQSGPGAHGANAAVLGVDIGTTSVKVIAVGVPAGQILHTWTREYASESPELDAHEQDPYVWRDLAITGLQNVRSALHGIAILAIGMSGHMHSLLLIDRAGRPVAPAMTWADRRAAGVAAELDRVARFERVGGNAVVTAFTAPKLAWVAQMHPQELARARRITPAKDFVRFCLTGEWGTDSTDAIGTLLWDYRDRDWDDELLSVVGARRRLMPEVHTSTDAGGAITAQMSELTGIPAGTPVVLGAGDVSALVPGIGLTAMSRIGMNVGTAAQIVALSDGLSDDAGGRFLFGSPWRREFVHMVPVYAAGATLRWFERVFLAGGSIDEVSANSTPGARGLGYLPFMFGTAVPWRDDAVRARYFGQTEHHTLADFARAALESVAYACAEGVAMVAAGRDLGSELRVVGGVTQSKIWLETLASVLDVPVVSATAGGSAVGAAIIAGVSVHAWDPDEAAARVIRTTAVPVPPTATRDAYREAAARFGNECGVLRAGRECPATYR